MTSTALDPVTVEVLWSRLLSVANEQQTALMRTAFSTIVRETQDLACGIFDTRGNMVAQSITGTPGHINAMATGIRHLLTRFPEESLSPGDVLVTNDPWMTVGQVNDITVATPMFRDGHIAGYFANTCHSPDIGGRLLSAEATEVYEEGLRIPPMKLFQQGQPNETLIAIMRENVRTPDETVGDLYAQTACNEVGADSLARLLDHQGFADLDILADEILARSEQALRETIRNVTNGQYSNEILCDGFDDQPIRLAVLVTVDDDTISLDFSGSSPQSSRGINVVENYTHAYASFAIKAAINPDVPHNHGSFRPVNVYAPPGSILNCTPPAPVAARHIIGHFIPGLVFGALAKAGADIETMASGADPIWISVWRGTDAASVREFTFSLFQCGGTGARSNKDGLSTTGFPSGVAGVPTEVVEVLTPLVQSRKELTVDSGGAGMYRGGLGQKIEVSCRTNSPWVASFMADRTRFRAEGVQGGHTGALGEICSGSGESMPSKTLLRLQPGETVKLSLPGGGGFGDPRSRRPESVLGDVVAGYVSLEAAAELYGVGIEYMGGEDDLIRLPSHYRIDWEATRELRGERSAK